MDIRYSDVNRCILDRICQSIVYGIVFEDVIIAVRYKYVRYSE